MNMAVEQNIITHNPFKDIPRDKKIKRKEVDRVFLTLVELELLAKTKTDIHKQVQQAFLFSCFTGLRLSDVKK